MDVDTRHLRALVAVVDEGTFTDAAIALRTSQASVSRSVQRLEAVVGHRLLARSTRHVALTPTGDRVLAHARRVLAALDRLAESAEADDGRLVVGYAWAALGEHTVGVQRAWSRDRGADLELVHANTPSAGLVEGRCDVSIVRVPVDDPRLASAEVGVEGRVAALASDHALADRGSLVLADLVGETIAVDAATGTTSAALWPADAAPGFRDTTSVDEWLTLIAAGRCAGVSSEATAAQHPRRGVEFRPLSDAPSITVRVVWWADEPPPGLDALLGLCRAAYGTR
ncbi:LysR family transcriptional regulator [Nocardioides iriomotensis]|uniref:LysR family transcriptional regulator n=1 Tax=Nocardioides iriomotensis TaxID=715784 RepID=A0A4Q5JCL4_9ACTN|nr:LysR family transcriptional regulator [Nocardioides iriomotensis]RYU15665.1 LysR family transcriptional regulator [Nocardioides iriomotensis]